MELVDKWETEGKITDDNRDEVNRYFTLFEEHISPKSNALIAIVELKRLFQGSMSLEDFHTKALRLVKEGEYPEGDTWNRILRDTIISGLASDKIQAKISKEGKDVTLARVMKIARLEISTRDILTECRKQPRPTMCIMGKDPRKERANQDPVVAVVVAVAAESTLENLLERARKFHYPLTSVGAVEKVDIRKVNPARQWKQFAGTLEPRDIMRKCV